MPSSSTQPIAGSLAGITGRAGRWVDGHHRPPGGQGRGRVDGTAPAVSGRWARRGTVALFGPFVPGCRRSSWTSPYPPRGAPAPLPHKRRRSFGTAVQGFLLVGGPPGYSTSSPTGCSRVGVLPPPGRDGDALTRTFEGSLVGKTDIAALLALGAAFFIAIGDVVQRSAHDVTDQNRSDTWNCSPDCSGTVGGGWAAWCRAGVRPAGCRTGPGLSAAGAGPAGHLAAVRAADRARATARSAGRSGSGRHCWRRRRDHRDGGQSDVRGIPGGAGGLDRRGAVLGPALVLCVLGARLLASRPAATVLLGQLSGSLWGVFAILTKWCGRTARARAVGAGGLAPVVRLDGGGRRRHGLAAVVVRADRWPPRFRR